jgi:predicted HicB family RNase H-like nuclease
MAIEPYPNRTIRLSDEVWEALKVAQKQSGKSWNQFIKQLINEPV